MRHNLPRDFYIPKGAAKIAHKTLPAVVYVRKFSETGRHQAMGFFGKANKPAFNYSFKDAARMHKYIAEWFSGLEKSAEYRAGIKKQRAEFVHDVKVGDIFRSSWGYDQTNIDFYQVVALVGSKMAEVREICQHSEETEFMQGKCVPAIGEWATECDYSPEGEQHKAKHGSYPRKPKAPFRVKIQGFGNGEPYIKVRGFTTASRIKPVADLGGAKVYGASHWTAYA